MRLIRVTAKSDWKGIFYIGWVMDGKKKTGISTSFGKKTFIVVK
jgi:hypothetical protein